MKDILHSGGKEKDFEKKVFLENLRTYAIENGGLF